MNEARLKELREWAATECDRWDRRRLNEALDEIERLQRENHDLKVLVETTLDTKNAEIERLKKLVGEITHASEENIRLREENEKLKKQYEEILSGRVIHAHHRAVLEENFALAARQCKDGYCDESGNWRCKYEDEIARLQWEIERLRLQLAACGVAAMCNTPESRDKQRIDKDNPYWSASYRDVCRAVDSEMRLRAALEKIAKRELKGNEHIESFAFQLQQLAREALEDK